jgi:periplasmic protein TonB
MKSILLFCFIICSFTGTAQDKNQFFALDKNMNQTVLDSSKYILWIHEKEDSNWQWDYYLTWGPLVKSTEFADHDGTIRNGRFCIYNNFGNLDSVGIYDHGKKNGHFYKYRSYTKDSLAIIHRYDYVEDSLVKSVNATSEKKKDSDTVDSKESEYPGGVRQWYYYLEHNLQYPERAVNKGIQGQVQMLFLVDENGIVQDPYIQKSVEYSIDQASIKLIRDSGKWTPALKDSVNVKSYKMQPVDFKLPAQ